MKKSDELRALAIIRVSSDEQARKRMSLESQEEWIGGIEAERDAKVVGVIRKVISGEIFPVKYFNKILKIADEKKINCIAIYAIDRFARNYPYGSMLLQKLHEKRNLRIITSLRTYDLNNREDRFWVGLLLVLAEKEQGDRLERTFRGMVTRLKRGEWPLSPPFGYEKVDYELRLLPGYKEIIRFIFHTFIRVKNYAETARMANDKYGKEKGFELTGTKIKKIVQDKTYLGYLRWNGLVFGEGEENKPRKELKAIDKKTFDKVQAVARRISRRYSRGNNGTIEKLIEKYGAESVIKILNLKPPCPKCNSYNLQRNGSEEKNGLFKLKYNCKDCGHQFRFPNEKQRKKIENSVSFPCRKCGSTDQFILEKDESSFWKLTCKKCGDAIFLQEYCDRHYPRKSSNIPGDDRKKKGAKGNDVEQERTKRRTKKSQVLPLSSWS